MGYSYFRLTTKVHFSIFNMSERSYITFCVKLDFLASQMLELLKAAFGDNVLSTASVFNWLYCLKMAENALRTMSALVVLWPLPMRATSRKSRT